MNTDPDTGLPIVYPAHVRGAGNYYFMLDGGLMSGPIHADGSITFDLDECCEVESWDTEAYDADRALRLAMSPRV